MNIEFGNPVMLRFAILAVVASATLAILWHYRRRKKFRGHFRTTVFKPVADARRTIFSYALGICALAFFFIALAEPLRSGTESIPGFRGAVVFDTSNSMKADDIRPNRLRAAGYTLQKFFETFPYGDAELIVFGAEPFSVCMTTDMSDLTWLVTKWLPENPDAAPVSGSDIAKAVIEAAHSPLAKDGIIIVISDGAAQSASEMSGAIAEVRKVGARVIAVGVGGDEYVQVQVSEKQFEPTRLEDGGLKALAQGTGGAYYRYRTGNELREAFYVYRSFLKPVTVPARKNYSSFPFGAALLCVFGWALVAYGKQQ